MPGKQMAIDADLNAGLIDDNEARRRRAEVAAEADFYGAMDGGSKFVKGDAIAAIFITLINLFGGVAIGLTQKGMSFSEAIDTYSLLTVGDGLTAQIPALMLAVATGLMVTRAATDGDMSSDVIAQLKGQRRTLIIAGGGIAALAIIPGMPALPFLVVEAAREVLGSSISSRAAMDGVLHVITLDPSFEQSLLSSSRAGQEGQVLAIDASILSRMSADIGRLVNAAEETGVSPVLICASQLRAPLYRQLRHEVPRLPILSYSELGGPIDIQTVGAVGSEPANVA